VIGLLGKVCAKEDLQQTAHKKQKKLISRINIRDVDL
jgi:hypothetical protein